MLLLLPLIWWSPFGLCLGFVLCQHSVDVVDFGDTECNSLLGRIDPICEFKTCTGPTENDFAFAEQVNAGGACT